MNKDEIVKVLYDRFYGNFASEVASKIIETNSFDDLWYIHVHYRDLDLTKSQREKVAFRSSYVIEKIYFTDFEIFRPRINEFFKFITTIENHSMMRHYAKICTNLLLRGFIPDPQNELANTLIKWSVDPKIKVAVKIWAVDSMLLLRKYEESINDYLPDILDSLSIEYKASIACRMRKWREML